MAAAVDGKLYVIGGQTEASSNSPFVDSVFQYDPATDRWTPRASMPTARSAGAAAVINGKIYVAGGRPPRGSDFAVYDPVADSWAALPDLPTQRNHLAAAAIGGRVYVAGGRFGGNYQSEVTDIVEVFDPATSAWSKGPLMLVKRSGHNSVLANGCWHIWGGEGNPDNETGLFPQHDVLNLATGQWTSLPPMAVTVHGVTGAAFLNGLIYVPGGGTAQGGSSGSTIHQVYRPAMTCP
jgi:N-acetylneuraminic acid mutarotase